MMKIALTGGIGCGKTTVCKLFSLYNTPVIDTDIIARKLVQSGSQSLSEIVSFFGSDILSSGGQLNRKKLAEKIFNNSDNKHKLESILHPRIRTEIQSTILGLPSETHYVIVDIPLLIETNQQAYYDKILIVDCSKDQQIQRTLERDNRELSEIKSIINSQITRKERLTYADDIIDNSKGINQLKIQVKQLHNKYMKL